ncbi:hypothetical protein ACM55I_06260 [Flavobacterium sp. GB2R13]|uniref:hypothetical protein n=1 Tax=Flavobacterium algoris TaxID=3398733 RepID=UPI003A8BFB30
MQEIFAILSKTGITDVYKSAITGDIGSSPITGAAILVRCTEVVGTIYTVDAAGALPCSVTNTTRLTTALVICKLHILAQLEELILNF